MARKKGKKKPATTFRPAPAVAKLAEQVIGQFHRHLTELDVRIEYIFRSDTPKKLGASVWATARKVTSLAAFFGKMMGEETVKPFFAIVVSEPIWCDLAPAQRVALVDHELCHCGARLDTEGNTVLYLIPHDLEEFREVVDRHGYWAPDVKRMAKSMAEAPQIEMDMGVER